MDAIRVLLVDDDKGELQALSLYLRTIAKFDVTPVASGQEAVEELRAARGKYTAMLMDYVLAPPMNGRQLLEKTRKAYPYLPIIVFTGVDKRGAQLTPEMGAYHYMPRPLDRTEMVNLVRNLAEQETVFWQIARDIRQMLQSDLCIAWQLDRAKRNLHIVGWDGEIDETYRKSVRLPTDSDGIAELLKREKPRYLEDVTLAPEYIFKGEAQKRGWRSLFSIPLIRQERIIGLLDSYTFVSRASSYSKEQIENWKDILLPIYARQVVETIKNIELSRQLSGLHGLNQLVASTFDDRFAINQILARGLQLVGADSGWVYYVEADGEGIVFKDSVGVPQKLCDVRRDLGMGITGWVAKHGETLVVPDVSQDKRYRSLPGVEVGSEIAVPLRREERTIGVVTVKRKAAIAFSSDDVDLLLCLASQAAVVAGRASLARHLQEISRLSVKGDFTKLANHVVAAARELTGSDVVLWTVSDREKERGIRFRIAAGSDIFDDEYKKTAYTPITPGSSITAQALELKHPVVRPNLQHSTEQPQFHNMEMAKKMGWHSFMAVPLFGQHGQGLGSLSVYGKEIHTFGTPEEVKPEQELLTAFANQVAVALEQQQAMIQQKTFSRVSSALVATAPTEIKRVMEAVVLGAMELTGTESGVVHVFDQSGQTIENSHGFPEAFAHPDPRPLDGEGYTFKVVRRKKQLQVPDAEVDPLVNERIRGLGVKAFVGTPLRLKNRVVGVLFVNDMSYSRHFTGEELSVLQTLADQAAIAIHNVTLFEQLKQEKDFLAALYELGNVLTKKTSLKDVLQTVADTAKGILPADTVVLYEYDERLDRVIIPPVHKGLKYPEVVDQIGPAHKGSAVMRIIRERRSRFVRDVKKSPLLYQHHASEVEVEPFVDREDIKSTAAVILESAGAIVGVLFVSYRNTNQFDSTEKNKIRLFANQAANAIERTRLNETRISELEAFDELDNKIARSAVLF